MSDTDKIKIKILPDGSLRIETDEISDYNHGGAEMLIRMIVEKSGGKETIETKGREFHHHHETDEWHRH